MSLLNKLTFGYFFMYISCVCLIFDNCCHHFPGWWLLVLKLFHTPWNYLERENSFSCIKHEGAPYGASFLMFIGNMSRSVMLKTGRTNPCLNARLMRRRYIDPRWWNAAFNFRSPCGASYAYLSAFYSVVKFYFLSIRVSNWPSA